MPHMIGIAMQWGVAGERGKRAAARTQHV